LPLKKSYAGNASPDKVAKQIYVSIAMLSLANITAPFAICGCPMKSDLIIALIAGFVVLVAERIFGTVKTVGCA
jgi:hypothetical protein